MMKTLVGSTEAYLYSVLGEVWSKVLDGADVPSELRGRFRLAVERGTVHQALLEAFAKAAWAARPVDAQNHQH